MPCPPFSIAGKQLGEADERDLFPRALRLIKESSPRAVLLENVRGLAGHRFDGYRGQILQCLHDLGYRTWWDRVQASMHGVPQLRPRFVLVAIRDPWAAQFRWPATSPQPPPTVGDALHDLMSSRGWPGAQAWRTGADGIAPTIVRGSKKHGGPDLGPTRARQAWRKLQVDGLGIADDPPGPEFPAGQMPKLTLRMVARIQGFPDTWTFSGRKTAACRQVGNAFPPPVAAALGKSIRDALGGSTAARHTTDPSEGADAALPPLTRFFLPSPLGCRQHNGAVSDSGTSMGAAEHPQTRPEAVTVPSSMLLTCRNVACDSNFRDCALNSGPQACRIHAELRGRADR